MTPLTWNGVPNDIASIHPNQLAWRAGSTSARPALDKLTRRVEPSATSRKRGANRDSSFELQIIPVRYNVSKCFRYFVTAITNISYFGSEKAYVWTRLFARNSWNTVRKSLHDRRHIVIQRQVGARWGYGVDINIKHERSTVEDLTLNSVQLLDDARSRHSISSLCRSCEPTMHVLLSLTSQGSETDLISRTSRCAISIN